MAVTDNILRTAADSGQVQTLRCAACRLQHTVALAADGHYGHYDYTCGTTHLVGQFEDWNDPSKKEKKP